ncbi:MAG: type II toxin-antitoxin system Phd/YefM family antitoxin [Roseburia sp.]|nr:type II toxin-antitoxin system Phd/YefM family antitoxin [Roseburia sp.]
MFAFQETIRPSADLRNHYNEILKQCRENNEVVIITVNGRGDTVSLAYEEYKRMKARIELLEIFSEAGLLNDNARTVKQ